MSNGFQGWLGAFYRQRLQWFVESYLADLFKGLLVLAGLMIVQAFLFGMRVMGYNKEALAQFESLHFWTSYSTLLALSISFVLRLVLSMFKSG